MLPLLRHWSVVVAFTSAGWLSAQPDGSQRWAFTTLSTSTAGNIAGSPAIGPDGTVYIGVEVGSSTSANPSGRLFAIDPNNPNTAKWIFPTTDWIDSTPTFAEDGTIYFGCWDGTFYALNPNGTTRWTYATDSYISGSPALAADGTIYLGTGTGSLHALKPDGTLKWTFPTSDWIESSPAVATDGTIYFGSWNDTFYAVAPNGVQKWEYLTGGDIVGSPAIAADGTVYVGSRDLKIYAFTPEGAVKWSVDTGDTVEASPSIGPDGTVYIATTGGRMLAFNPDGTERWRYPADGQAALNSIYSSAAIRADGSILFGSSDNALYALSASGTLLWKATLDDWADSSPVVASDGSIYIGCSDKKLYAINGNGQALASAAPWPAFRRNATRTGRSPLLAINSAPVSQPVAAGSTAVLSAAATATDGGAAPSPQWQQDGVNLVGESATTLTVANFQPAHAGLYAALFAGSATQATAGPAILGLVSTDKVLGAAYEFQGDIQHQNGNIYDQVLLQGGAASITADAGQVTRISFIDVTDDIVQVEFSGPGTLTVVLDNPSGPAPPVNYEQNIDYVKGHARIVIAGATQSTHVSVFSVGRITAVNQSLFKDVDYDGLATIASLAIQSSDGKFGGIRTANTSYLATRGLTGIYAPGVQFTGPVLVGDITAAETATPVLLLGAALNTAQINGGDLLQQNDRPVQISGITQLNFVDGTTSHGGLLPAQTGKGQLQENGAIVTESVVAP